MSSSSSSSGSIPEIYRKLGESVKARIAHPVEYRKQQLLQIIRFLDEKREEIVDAMAMDLKSRVEAHVELAMCVSEAVNAINCLDEWARPKAFRKNPWALGFYMDAFKIVRDPLGLVLIIGPWNYPLNLAILPIIGAIAGGNAVVFKPSEVAGNTASVLGTLMPLYLDPRTFAIVQGAVNEVNELLTHRFDHILFTGAGAIGKLVYEKAAKFLTPVTLELGGKSPTIVTRSASTNLRDVALNVIFAKWLNAGQTCIAPDYVLCDEKVFDDLLKHMIAAIEAFKGDSNGASDGGFLDPKQYGRIINDRHFGRIKGLLDKSISSKCKILYDGKIDAGSSRGLGGKHIWLPTILQVLDPDCLIMKEEIFGPLLPIITYKEIGEVVSYINDRDKPLALYIFSHDEREIDRVLTETSSGTAVVNDCALQYATDMPFGGVGASGFGSYKGYRSFETFTHEKRVLVKNSGWLSSRINQAIRYPPYKDSKVSLLLRALFYDPQESEIRSGRFYTGLWKALAIVYNLTFRSNREI